jgi:hypothetical protein
MSFLIYGRSFVYNTLHKKCLSRTSVSLNQLLKVMEGLCFLCRDSIIKYDVKKLLIFTMHPTGPTTCHFDIGFLGFTLTSSKYRDVFQVGTICFSNIPRDFNSWEPPPLLWRPPNYWSSQIVVSVHVNQKIKVPLSVRSFYLLLPWYLHLRSCLIRGTRRQWPGDFKEVNCLPHCRNKVSVTSWCCHSRIVRPVNSSSDISVLEKYTVAIFRAGNVDTVFLRNICIYRTRTSSSSSSSSTPWEPEISHVFHFFPIFSLCSFSSAIVPNPFLAPQGWLLICYLFQAVLYKTRKYLKTYFTCPQFYIFLKAWNILTSWVQSTFPRTPCSVPKY